ncbi:MAG: low molecular weight protein tyrosine phosphatase family protein [Prosthecobacter sp.]
MKILFLCSRNQWRSPTAEKVYQNDPRVEVRSAGTSASACCRVSEKLLLWADRVMVMEHAHKQRLREQFSEIVRDLNIDVLDIPDDYTFMNPELVALIHERVEPLLEESTREL